MAFHQMRLVPLRPLRNSGIVEEDSLLRLNTGNRRVGMTRGLTSVTLAGLIILIRRMGQNGVFSKSAIAHMAASGPWL